MINDAVLYSIEQRLGREFFGIIVSLDIEFGYRKNRVMVCFEPAYEESHQVELKFDLVEEEEELYENIKAGIKDELRHIVGELKNFIRKSEQIGIE